VFTEKLSCGAHLGGGFFEYGEQLAGAVQAPDDHDYERLYEQPVRIDPGPPATGASLGRRGRNAINKAQKLDKDGLLGDHGRASEGSVIGHSPCSEAFLARSSPSSVPRAIYDQPSSSCGGSSLTRASLCRAPSRSGNVLGRALTLRTKKGTDEQHVQERL